MPRASADAPLYLSAAAVAGVLGPDEVYRVVEEVLRSLPTGAVFPGPKAGFEISEGGRQNHVGSVSGGLASRNIAGVKWFTVADANPRSGLPRVPAYMLVTAADSGMLLGAIDATMLTPVRTAAMALVAVRALGRARLGNVAIIGCGKIGAALAHYLKNADDVDVLTVAARRLEAAQELKTRLQAEAPHRRMEAQADFEASVRDADVIFSAVALEEEADLLRAEWFRPGAVFCGLGSKRDVERALLARAWIVSDDPEGLEHRNPNYRVGGIVHGRVRGTLTDLFSGKLKPPASDQVCVLALVGTGVLDVALAGEAVSRARDKALGIVLSASEGALV